MSFDDEDTIFHVVVNHEEQYSIWPDYKPIPNGWRTAGKMGKKKDCLDYIEQVWTDMRPLSLRLHMQASEGSGDERSSAAGYDR
jgi:MbtH protein